MKVLALADIHSSLERLKDLKESLKSEKIDLIVFCGDFTNEGSLKIAEKIIEGLSFAPLLAVPGNQDSKEIIELLESKGISIHKKTVDFQSYSFIGIGGGKPVHTFYRVNVGELEAEKFFKNNYPETKNPVIVVSHTPSSGTGLELAGNGSRLGLQALRAVIEARQPLLLLHGHVHESAGEEMIGKTLCINTGAVMDGKAVLLEIKGFEKPKIERLEF